MQSKWETEHPLILIALEDALELLPPAARRRIEEKHRKAVGIVAHYKAADDAALAAFEAGRA